MTLSVFLLGLVMGMRHALEADHVAAVGALATGGQGRSGAIRLGTLWGIGHASALFAAGGIFFAFDWGGAAAFSGWVELVVGFLLVWLGGGILWRMAREHVHFHVHDHGARRHFHAHRHGAAVAHDIAAHVHLHAKGPNVRALLVGVVHGMAGSAALVVLALGAVQSFWQAVAYMAAFGIGSIAGMAALSAAISVPVRLSAKHMTRAFVFLQGGVGAWTAALGLIIVVERAGSLLI